MKNYVVLVSFEALEVLPKSGRRRDAVIDFIHGLNDYTYVRPDFTMTDPETGRVYSVNKVAGFAVVWWVDGPDCEVKIVRITPVD